MSDRVGPFGGMIRHGEEFDDIVGIDIVRSVRVGIDIVRSVRFGIDVEMSRLVFLDMGYLNNGGLVRVSIGDETQAKNINLFDVAESESNQLVDYITTVEGTYLRGTLPSFPSGFINSIRFSTARGITSPTFGSASGTREEVNFVMRGRANTPLIGLHGRLGTAFISLGAHFRLPDRVDAIGAVGGNPWDDGFHHRVQRVTVGIRNNFGVAFLRFDYADSDNTPVLGVEHGTAGQDVGVVNTDTLLIDDNDFIEAVTGTYTGRMITSVCFRLHNRNQQHQYGLINGEPFELGGGARTRVLGFHGRCTNREVTALGVHLFPAV